MNGVVGRGGLRGPTRGDLVAGITVALVLVPQSLAYAELAGLSPVHGLYAAAVAPIAGALIGSSPYLQTGPVALTSLLTLGAVAPLVPPSQPDRFAGYAAVLALLVGAVRLGLGLLRWGALAYFLSLPVVTGFTVAAALLIIFSQLPGLTGVAAGQARGDPTTTAGAAGENPVRAGLEVLADPGTWSLGALGIGLATLVLVLVGRWWRARFPWVLAATVTGLVVTGAGLLSVPELGPVPGGLPVPQLELPWQAVPHLLLPAVVIALVGFAEPASIARRYAEADRRPWDPDREFCGQGLANLAAGVFGGYPTGGSFSRSALNRDSGARTRWSGAVTGCAVLVALPAAGIFSGLPVAVLAAIVIASVVSLVDVSEFRDYWHYSRPQFLVAVPTFVVTLLAAPRLERGLLVGVALALGIHLWRETRIHVDVDHRDGVLRVRPEGVLYFASAPALGNRLAGVLDRFAPTRHVVVDLHRLGRLDLTGLLALRGFVGYAHAAGATVEIRGVPGHAWQRASRVFAEHDPPVPLHRD